MKIMPFMSQVYTPVRYIGVMGFQVRVATVVTGAALCIFTIGGLLGGAEWQKAKKEPLYLINKSAIYANNPITFEKKVRNVASALGVPPEWLMAVMYSESRLNHRALNLKGSGATGLIQFMPATAIEMGTTARDLSNMDNIEQMQWVYNYLKGYMTMYGNYTSLCDLYLAILYPRARAGDYCYTLYSSPSKAYKQNAGLDEDKDGRVTVGDIDKRMKRLYPTAYIAGQQDNTEDTITTTKQYESFTKN